MNRTVSVKRAIGFDGLTFSAGIAYEDTAERDVLKGAGYRWVSSAKVWERNIANEQVAAQMADLVARGYAVDVTTFRSVVENLLAKRGVDLSVTPLVRYSRGEYEAVR